MEKSKKIYFFLVISCFLLFLIILFYPLSKEELNLVNQDSSLNLPNNQFALENNSSLNSQINSVSSSQVNFVSQSLPSKIDIPVPFTSQAPFALWDDLHNNACEEAVLIMAKYFVQNRENLSQEMAEEEILKAVAFQEENWGGHFDLEAEKIIELGKTHFKLEKIYLEKEVTVDSIKKHLSQGEIIIAPTAGRNLENPYFRRPGPVYHTLIIRGYEKNNFITNDPGTKRGEKFIYSQNNILDSISNWPGEFGKHYPKEEAADLIQKGEKAIIIIAK